MRAALQLASPLVMFFPAALRGSTCVPREVRTAVEIRSCVEVSVNGWARVVRAQGSIVRISLDIRISVLIPIDVQVPLDIRICVDILIPIEVQVPLDIPICVGILIPIDVQVPLDICICVGVRAYRSPFAACERRVIPLRRPMQRTLITLQRSA